jgi:hypothetical protein
LATQGFCEFMLHHFEYIVDKVMDRVINLHVKFLSDFFNKSARLLDARIPLKYFFSDFAQSNQ